MSDATLAETEEKPASGRRRLLLILAVVFLMAAGAGVFIARLGVLPFAAPSPDAAPSPAGPEIAFVPIDPLLISLGSRPGARHLRFEAQLEVPRGSEREVTTVMPRIVDVLNGYLRAVDMAQLERPSALVRLRAQMLRRVQMVAGPENVTDLLIMEFVLN